MSIRLPSKPFEQYTGRLRLFTGNAHPALAYSIAHHLGVPIGEINCSRFNDGEIRVQVEESARGNDVFLIQPTCAPVNDNLMELLIMIDAFRRASAERITVVLPYYGYAPAGQKDQAPRTGHRSSGRRPDHRSGDHARGLH